MLASVSKSLTKVGVKSDIRSQSVTLPQEVIIEVVSRFQVCKMIQSSLTNPASNKAKTAAICFWMFSNNSVSTCSIKSQDMSVVIKIITFIFVPAYIYTYTLKYWHTDTYIYTKNETDRQTVVICDYSNVLVSFCWIDCSMANFPWKDFESNKSESVHTDLGERIRVCDGAFIMPVPLRFQ